MSINPNKIKVKEYFTPERKKKLTYWEKNFISSLYNHKNNWTEKQLNIFNEIIEKYKFTQVPVKIIHSIAPEKKYDQQQTIKVKNIDKVTRLSDAYIDKSKIINRDNN